MDPWRFLPSPAAVHFLGWVLEINNEKFLNSRNTQIWHHCQDELSIIGTEGRRVPGGGSAGDSVSHRYGMSAGEDQKVLEMDGAQ